MAKTQALTLRGIAPAAPRPKHRSRGKSSKETWKLAAAGLAGGAAGALTGALLMRASVSPTTSAAVVTVAGGAAALASKGMIRAAAIGLGATGAGQLVLVLLTRHEEKKREEEAKTAGPERQLAGKAEPELLAAAPSAAKDANPQPRQGLAREDDDLMRAFKNIRAQSMVQDEAREVYRRAA